MSVASESPFQFADFRAYQIARFFSISAAAILNVAVAWHVYELTRDPLGLGWVGLVQFLPAIGFSLLTGHVADRVEKKRVLQLFYLAMVVGALVLAWIATTKSTQTWPIYLVLFCTGTARAFAGPASSAMLPRLVPESFLARAIGWSTSVWQVGNVGGPALGGVLYAVLRDAAWVYLVCAGMYLVAFLSGMMIQSDTTSRSKEPATLSSLFAGVRYVWSNKLLLGAISLDLVAVLLGGAVALLPIYAKDILRAGPIALGLLRTAPGVGAVVAAVWLAVHPMKSKAGLKMLGGILAFGLATVVFGLSKNFWLSLAALVVTGAADMVSVVVRQLLLQLATPDAMRGRVTAVNMVFVGASNELGEFESGVTASWLGAVPAVVLGGLGTIASVVACAYLFPSLRKLEEVEPAKEDAIVVVG